MPEITMYGIRFPLGRAVDVKDPFAQRKLSNHPHFKAEYTREEVAEDVSIKREFSHAASLQLARAEAELKAERKAEEDQAKANADRDEQADSLKTGAVRSEYDYQRLEEQQPLARAFNPDTEVNSADEYQRMEDAGILPAGAREDNSQDKAAKAKRAK